MAEPQQTYSNPDFLEGYTKAKNEDKEELNKALEALHNLEKEYMDLKQISMRDAQFVKDNTEYAELGHAMVTLLRYLKGDKNE